MKNKVFKILTPLVLVVLLVATMVPLFGIGAAAEGETYELVTDASMLKANDKILIVCPSKNMVMAAQSGTYRAGATVTITDNKITTLPDGAQVITLGGETGSWTLAVNDTQYLYWDSSNSVKTGVSYEWTINIENETAAIASKNTPERKLQWNASSPRFACYTSAQTAIALYKLTTSDAPDETTNAPACEHIPVADAYKAPTCTETGLTEGSHCELCGETIVAQDIIRATGHQDTTGDGICDNANCPNNIPTALKPADGKKFTFFYQEEIVSSEATARDIRVICVINESWLFEDLADISISIPFSNGTTTRTLTVRPGTVYRKINATVDNKTQTYSAESGNLMIGWIITDVPTAYKPTTATVDATITIEKALEITNALAADGQTTESYIVTGTISGEDTYMYHITDGENTIGLFGKSKFNSYTVLVGDTVTVKGQLKNYKGDTPEFVELTVIEYTAHDHVCTTLANKCDICGTITTHDCAYTDVCDADCNLCGETRKAPHSPEFSCSTSCQLCNSPVVAGEHVDTNPSDGKCDFCNANLADAPASTEIVLDFVTNFGTYANAWGSGYANHEITFEDTGATGDGKVVLSNANKQTSTITDRPVICAKNVAQYVTVDLGTSTKTISAVTFDLQQWGTKTFSDIHIEYTTDGTTWISCSDSITTPGTLSSTGIPTGAKSVRLSFVASKNSNTQIGLSKITLTING